MTTYRPGDVVLVPFPFTDLSTTKQRPAVILSSARFNRQRRDVVLAAITSYTGGRIAWDEYLLDSTEQREAGLPRASLVKVGKIVTIEQTLLRRRLGRVPPATRAQLLEIVLKVIQQ